MTDVCNVPIGKLPLVNVPIGKVIHVAFIQYTDRNITFYIESLSVTDVCNVPIGKVIHVAMCL